MVVDLPLEKDLVVVNEYGEYLVTEYMYSPDEYLFLMYHYNPVIIVQTFRISVAGFDTVYALKLNTNRT